MAKVDEKLLDEQITQCLQDGYIEGLKDLIELPDDIIKRLFINEMERPDNTEIQIPPDILQEIFIARDRKVLGLKKYDIKRVKAEDLQFDDEMHRYNVVIQENDEITVVHGKDKNGKDNVLYYYFENCATRQQRIFNEHGDVESMYRHVMGKNGRLSYLDNALVSYQYDNQGKKKAALYQDYLAGITYYEYDKEGKAIMMISDNGETYTTADGCIALSTDDYIYKKTSPKQWPVGWEEAIGIPQNNSSELEKMDENIKEEIFSILDAIKPVFQSLSTDVYTNEQEAREKMEKVITWFTGFAKRLRIDPKLATQDSAVMSTMKGAVSKTIGKTKYAETDLMTPLKDEKEYEGEDYGDN